MNLQVREFRDHVDNYETYGQTTSELKDRYLELYKELKDDSEIKDMNFLNLLRSYKNFIKLLLQKNDLMSLMKVMKNSKLILDIMISKNLIKSKLICKNLIKLFISIFLKKGFKDLSEKLLNTIKKFLRDKKLNLKMQTFMLDTVFENEIFEKYEIDTAIAYISSTNQSENLKSQVENFQDSIKNSDIDDIVNHKLISNLKKLNHLRENDVDQSTNQSIKIIIYILTNSSIYQKINQIQFRIIMLQFQIEFQKVYSKKLPIATLSMDILISLVNMNTIRKLLYSSKSADGTEHQYDKKEKKEKIRRHSNNNNNHLVNSTNNLESDWDMVDNNQNKSFKQNLLIIKDKSISLDKIQLMIEMTCQILIRQVNESTVGNDSNKGILQDCLHRFVRQYKKNFETNKNLYLDGIKLVNKQAEVLNNSTNSEENEEFEDKLKQLQKQFNSEKADDII